MKKKDKRNKEKRKRIATVFDKVKSLLCKTWGGRSCSERHERVPKFSGRGKETGITTAEDVTQVAPSDVPVLWN